MKNKFLSILFLMLLTFGFCYADGGVDFSGDVEAVIGASAHWRDRNAYKGHFTLGDAFFTGKLDAYYNNFSGYANFSFIYNAVELLNTITDFDNKTKVSNFGYRSFSMNEAWIDYSGTFWSIRLGRQNAAWGKADGIDITNVLCPNDMSSFAAITSDNSKLGVDALRLSLNGNSFTADAWWIPFFTPAKLPLDEGNMLRKLMVPETVAFPVPAFSTTLVLPVKINEFEKPKASIKNGEYGLKLSGYLSALDVSLYGFYGWDDIPMLNYAIAFSAPQFPYPAMPNGMVISGEYKRMAMLGADAALPIGPTVLRLETAYFPKRHFQKSAESILAGSGEFSEQHNELSALVGIDWMPAGWTFTAQYHFDRLYGDLKLLERTDKFTHGATFSASRNFLNETLEAGLSFVLNFDDFDTMFAPSVKYSVSDQTSVSLGAYIFLAGPGGRTGEYGKYKNLSTFYMKGKYSF